MNTKKAQDILDQILSLDKTNYFLKYIVNRLTRDDYRGWHISQHNRYDLDDIIDILKIIHNVSGEEYFAILPGDHGRESTSLGCSQYREIVNKIKKKIGRGTINSIKKNFFPDLNRMGFLERTRLNTDQFDRATLHGRLRPNAIEFINSKVLIEQRAAYTSGIDKLSEGGISELVEMIYLNYEGDNLFSIYEFMFIFSDKDKYLDKIKLLDSYRKLKDKHLNLKYLIQKYATPDNFKGNKTVRRDFHNWKNQTQQIIRLLVDTVYFEFGEKEKKRVDIMADPNRSIRLNFSESGYFKKPANRNAIPRREYFNFHQVEKQKHFELHHIVPISLANDRGDAKLIDDKRNLIYIHRSMHKKITENGNRRIKLTIDEKKITFSEHENTCSVEDIEAINGKDVIYTKEPNILERMNSYNSRLLESIFKS